MPIYRYSCSKCGEFEVIQSASAKPCKCDPECKHKDCPKDAERMVPRSSFQLAGEGWYKDLYSKGGSKKTSEKSSETTSDSTTTKKSCGSKCSCH